MNFYRVVVFHLSFLSVFSPFFLLPIEWYASCLLTCPNHLNLASSIFSPSQQTFTSSFLHHLSRVVSAITRRRVIYATCHFLSCFFFHCQGWCGWIQFSSSEKFGYQLYLSWLQTERCGCHALFFWGKYVVFKYWLVCYVVFGVKYHTVVSLVVYSELQLCLQCKFYFLPLAYR